MAPPAPAAPENSSHPDSLHTGSPHTATVAGVPVDTRHWIGGQRVASASGATFTDHSPLDDTPLAEIARGGAEEARAAVA
ncbi:MAG: hypothetical protein WCD21_35450, partial [Streptomyces sp.]